MTYQFKLASQITEPLHGLIGIAGGSACGKTYSAMLIAEALADGKPFAIIDTEAGRARHYKSRFEFLHCDFTPFDPKTGELVGYSPERYIEVIDAAEKKGFPVIIIDSFSHAWEGLNGVLQLHAQALDAMTGGNEAKRDKVSILAWGKVKPRWRLLLHRIIQCRAHVILCIRAKERPQGIKTISKIRRQDLNWDVACDKDLIFEMTASFLLLPEKVGVPVPIKLPDEIARAFPTDRQITSEAGKVLKKWSESGGSSSKDDKSVIDEARREARKGFDAINAFWQSLDKGDQSLLRPIMGELKRISKEADTVDNDIPFGEDDEPNHDREGEEHAATAAREAEAAMKRKED